MLIAVLIYFLLWNTQYYYWQILPGPLDLLTYPLLILISITLFVLALKQFYLLANEKFNNRNRIFICLIIFIMLPFSYIYPTGLIDFSKYESKNLLVAAYEGVANCLTKLEFKENNRFKKTIYCFGVDTFCGNYKITNDTLILEFDKITDDNGDGAYAVLISCDQESNPNFECLLYFQKKDDKRWLQFGIRELNLDELTRVKK